MIEVRAKGPRLLEGTVAHLEAEFPLDRKAVWIGRGEELSERETNQSFVLNLGGLSQAVSRNHACLLLSPSFFYPPQQPFPSFLSRIAPIASLPSHLLVLLWQFVQSPRKILLRDMGSKAGVFRKITRCKIEAGMQVVLGDSRPLVFHNQEIYDREGQVSDRVKELVEKGYTILNPGGGAFSFWILSFKGIHLLLLDRPGRLLIGRSSDCHLAIAQASISRRHAHLDYGESGWQLGDGDGVNLSSNGVWIKTRKMWVQYRRADMQPSEGQRVAKLGDVLLNLSIKEEHSMLGVEECLDLNRSTDESFGILLRKQMQEASIQSPCETTTEETAHF